MELFHELCVTLGYRTRGERCVSSVADPVRDTSVKEQNFHALFDAFPAAVYTTNADGYVTFYNRAAEELAGRTPRVGQDKWNVIWKLRRADGSELPHDQCPMAIALREGRAVRDSSVIAVRPDGAAQSAGQKSAGGL